MLTGCGKNKKEDNTTPVVETPVVETTVVQEPAETGIGDVVVLTAFGQEFSHLNLR
jgi:UTP-glucose-1-phosphate uridylyltransferase